MIFDKLPLNPFAFAQLTQRQRMMNQLRGAGLGRTGLEQVIRTNGGQVGFLAGVSRLGMLGEGYYDCPGGCQVGYGCDTTTGQCLPCDFLPNNSKCNTGENLMVEPTFAPRASTALVPTAKSALSPSGTMSFMPTASSTPTSTATVDTSLQPSLLDTKVSAADDQQNVADLCMGIICPTGQYCENGSCIPSKVVEQTGDGPTVLDDDDDGAPKYADGTKVDSGDVDAYSRGDGGAADYDRYDGGGGGGGSSAEYPTGSDPAQVDPTQTDPAVAAAAAAQTVEERDIPWGWILGGVAAVGIGYKFLGKRR